MIRDYYRHSTILLTGATGLLGKVVLETILRNLPEVHRIYLLIRERSDETAGPQAASVSLWKEIIESTAFDELRQRHGDDFDAFIARRLEAVAGDLAQPGLGMEPRVYRRVQQEVDIIINSGALAVFDAPVDQALEINTLGPQRIAEFARGCRKRPFIAHVSTCYVNNGAGPIFETPLDPEHLPPRRAGRAGFDVEQEVAALRTRIDRIRNGETEPPLSRLVGLWGSITHRAATAPAGNGVGQESEQAQVQHRLVQEGLCWAHRRGWTDTYTFTKAMGELLFDRHRGSLPGLILRPSIIESSLSTPAPGWIDGFRMADPLIVGFARHQLFEFPGNPEAVLDMVPADLVANALLAAIPWTHRGGGGPVYHVASGMDNPLTLKQFHRYLVEYFRKWPLRRGSNGKALPDLTFPEPERFLREIDYRYLLPLRLKQWLYAPLKRTRWGHGRYAQLCSRRARLERLRHTAAIYGPYAASRSRYLTFNLRALGGSMAAGERQHFPCDIRNLDWQRYVQQIHLPGIERYLLRMPRRLRERSQPVDHGPGPEEVGRSTIAAASSQPGRGGQAAEALAEQCRRSERTLTRSHDARTMAEPAVAVDEPIAASLPDGMMAKWPKAEKLLSATRVDPNQQVCTWASTGASRFTQRMSLSVIRTIAKRRLELDVSDSHHVPARSAFILASNHTSHIDTGVLLAALGPAAGNVHPTAAADYWFRSRLVRWVLHATLGAIPFARHSRNVPRALARLAEALRQGRSLIFYPEGSRSPTGQMRPFKSTVGLLALAAGVPVVPAHISGAYEALPKGHRWMRQHPVKVRFGAPTSIEPYLAQLGLQSAAHVAGQIASDIELAVAALKPSSPDGPENEG